ncbi:MAG: tyrosine-protein phosphatase [Puniceicoccales bacterium]|jgi:protein tyrosine/serine phosphatase|nr:tyrosine-protein phosphatase [Puniceicoccales bacterium]
MMKAFPALLLLCVFCLSGGCSSKPIPEEERPVTWGQPVQSTTLGNFYKISPDLFRSEYPAQEDIADIKEQGIKSIINLRSSNDRSEVFQAEGLTTYWHKTNAGSISQQDMVDVFKFFEKSPKPALIHCWHGSDRTGFIVAGYRIIYQGWSKEEAIRELRQGGYGFHEIFFGNIIDTLNDIDVEAMRKEIGVSNS